VCRTCSPIRRRVDLSPGIPLALSRCLRREHGSSSVLSAAASSPAAPKIPKRICRNPNPGQTVVCWLRAHAAGLLISTSRKVFSEAKATIDQLRSSQNPQVLTALLSMQSYLAQMQSYRQTVENNTNPSTPSAAGSEPASDTDPPESAPSPAVVARRIGAGASESKRTLEGTLVQIDCQSNGSGRLYLQDGARLLQLGFKSFSAVAASGPGLSCSTRNRRMKAEYTVNGMVQTISLAK
jgi:hypothetical protein